VAATATAILNDIAFSNSLPSPQPGAHQKTLQPLAGSHASLAAHANRQVSASPRGHSGRGDRMKMLETK
jgi:hypothetical protein